MSLLTSPRGLYILGGVLAVAVVVLLNADDPADNASVMAADAGVPSTAMLGGSPSRNMVNLVEKNLLDDFAVRPKGKEKNVKWAANPGQQVLRRACRSRRTGLRQHQQRSSARSSDQGRQGRRHVLPRIRRQVPLADRPRQAGRRRSQRLSARRHRLHPVRRGRPALLRQQPLRAGLCAIPPATKRPARGRSSGSTTWSRNWASSHANWPIPRR